MNELEVVRLELSAKPGASIGEALKEGLLYSVKEWRNVTVEFNGELHKIYVNELLATIKKVSKE